MNRYRFALLSLAFSLTSGFTSGVIAAEGTISQLNAVKPDLKDEKVDGRLDKALQASQRFLEGTPEAMHRLADFKFQRASGAGSAAARKAQSAEINEAIALYKKVLDKYPKYQRRDQVLYQLSHAYDEVGDEDEAIKVINRIIKEYPNSPNIEEFQYRKAEYYFNRQNYKEAEIAYKALVDAGAKSPFYEPALYKLAWSLFKQERYADALQQYFALIDYKASTGYNAERASVKPDEKQRVDDTYRAINLAFSYLGGGDAVSEYFDKHGKRPDEITIYNNLGEYYLGKQRYDDAAKSYKAFVKRNPYDKLAPQFDMRVGDAYKKGGFSKLVIEANKEFVTTYGLKSEYWKRFDLKLYPEVVAYVKTNLKELAKYYHSLYQDKTLAKDKDSNAQEAVKWYRAYLAAFPAEPDSAAINLQMAQLLLENKQFDQAALEYERIAKEYPTSEKTAEAAYAAIYARRESLASAPQAERARVQREVDDLSLKFVESFPKHEKAPSIMAAVVESMYAAKNYDPAVATARKLLATYPGVDQTVRLSAWLVIAHASLDQEHYAEAEEGYQQALSLTPEKAATRDGLNENLAAVIYKQGEQANKQGDYKSAAAHFLRVGKLVPSSKIRANADFDAATALMQLKDWDKATEVLLAFRSNHAGHPLQIEVTKKLASIYRDTGKPALAAAEYERMESGTQDQEARRELLLLAADLYTQAKDEDKALQIYRRYVSNFPKPLEPALEARNKIATALKERNDNAAYLSELKQIVDMDAGAGSARTDRTRYLGGTAALTLTEPLFTQFADIRLVKPFNANLAKKTSALKSAREAFEKLLSYKVGDVTSAANYYIAEMYYNFSHALNESERPDDLSPAEKEQYELALEEQAFPFEEKSIQTHEKNLELMPQGIYSTWIEKSIERLAKMVPARYAKSEESTGLIAELDVVDYDALIASRTAQSKQIAVLAVNPLAADGRPLGRRALLQRQTELEQESQAQAVTPVVARDAATVSAPSRSAPARPAVVIDPEVRRDFDAAMSYLKVEQYGRGIEVLSKLTEKPLNTPIPYIDLAIASRKVDNIKLAEESLKRAIGVDASNPIAANEFGIVYRKTGRFNEARQQYDRAVQQYPKFFMAHRNLGILCDLYLRDYACALKEYEIYGAAVPEDKAVKLWIADMQKRVKR
ncbi:MAG: tetratricopeptide repeat protein [Pseudomonadota bacterium]